MTYAELEKQFYALVAECDRLHAEIDVLHKDYQAKAGRWWGWLWIVLPPAAANLRERGVLIEQSGQVIVKMGATRALMTVEVERLRRRAAGELLQ